MFDIYVASLRAGMAVGLDYCFEDDWAPSSLNSLQVALASAIEEGIRSPLQRAAPSLSGAVLLNGHLAERGLDMQKLQGAQFGESYPGACSDYVTFIETLNTLDLDDARILRANIIGAIAVVY